MRKLDKATIAQRDEIQARLAANFSALEQAVEAYNETMQTAWEAVQKALDDYNEAISDANGWQQDVAAGIQDYMDERSEKWLESDKGQEYEAWRGEFEEEINTAELDQPEPLDLSNIEDAAEVLGNRNESLGGE